MSYSFRICASGQGLPPPGGADQTREGRKGLVAPVEVARTAPEPGVVLRRRLLVDLLAGPRRRHRAGDGCRHRAVERVLDPGLLLGLEERMVVERVRDLVAAERHRVLEPGVALLELEVVLDHTGKDRRCLHRHAASSLSGPGLPWRAIVTPL